MYGVFGFRSTFAGEHSPEPHICACQLYLIGSFSPSPLGKAPQFSKKLLVAMASNLIPSCYCISRKTSGPKSHMLQSSYLALPPCPS